MSENRRTTDFQIIFMTIWISKRTAKIIKKSFRTDLDNNRTVIIESVKEKPESFYSQEFLIRWL